jgi:hypothetical protein
MQYKPYTQLESVPDLSIFRFKSKGPVGLITKEIRFAELPDSGMYSVHMGDIKQNGDFDQSAISNNGDRNRVLATVIVAIEIYTKKYPARSILIGGFNEQRARLFRMAIGVNFERISRVFTVLEVLDGRFLPFKPDTKSTVFHLRRRKLHGKSICEIPICVLTNDEEATKIHENLLREKADIFEMCAKRFPEEENPALRGQVNEMNDAG